jgi:hypothetical protein
MELLPLHNEFHLAKTFTLKEGGLLRVGGHLPLNQMWTLVLGGKNAGAIWRCEDAQDGFMARSLPQADFFDWLEAKGGLQFSDEVDEGEDFELGAPV